ncbi:MAG: hypothetical protein ABR591_11930 [Candidatus Velthaea sp.]
MAPFERLFMVACLVLLAGCGGGGSSMSPPAAAPAQPTAPTGTTTSSVATGKIHLSSAATVAALPAIDGVSGTLRMPGVDVPGGVDVSVETTSMSPSDAPSLQAAQSRRKPLSGAINAVFFMTLQSPITITLSTLPGITIDLPQSAASAGQFFYGFTDPTIHDVAVALRTEGPGREAGTSFTFTASPNPLTLQAGQRVVFAFFSTVQVARAPGFQYVDYTGTPRASLDAIQATGEFSTSNQMISLEAKMAGPIVDGNDNIYVWGINRGGGTNTFPDEPNVLFNAVVVVHVGPTGAIIAPAVNLLSAGPPVAQSLPTANVFIKNQKVQMLVPAALLPTTGLSPSSYTWNLWPRVGLGGLPSAQIQDFIPDNASSAAASAAAATTGDAAIVARSGASAAPTAKAPRSAGP